jgi:hypothetical protein
MDNNNDNGLQNIKKMYENLTYFDDYGGTFVVFVLITICLLLFISYCHVLINIQPIRDSWPTQRCKLGVMPFAGLIMKHDGMSTSEYTYKNFNYCTQSVLSNISGDALEPLTYVSKVLNETVAAAEKDIQEIRKMFDKIRNFVGDISQEIMGRLMNIMPQLQEIIISFKDIIGKVQGTVTAALFTLLGSYYTLKALLGAIVQFIVIILISLAAMIAMFWIFPFTWGVAISSTAIFVALSIPLALILTFMTDVLKINTNLGIPTLPAPHIKCFDKNVLFTMNDGSKKPICDIAVGDILFNNNRVTAKIIVEREGSVMYKFSDSNDTDDDIIVSDSHIVKYNDNWIKVSEHPDAKPVENYKDKYLYCLNTESKEIVLGSIIFTDWDEIYDNDLNEIKNNNLFSVNETSEIHTYLDCGFAPFTQINLLDGSSKSIYDICVGEILSEGEKVYGIVEIDGTSVNEQYKINLGNGSYIEGGPNLNFCSKFSKTLHILNYKEKRPLRENEKHKKLYHLLTNIKTFNAEKWCFYDYNAAIDLLLEKHRGKLLSMKYV